VEGTICKKILTSTCQKNLLFEDKDFQFAENTLDLKRKVIKPSGAATTERRCPQGVDTEEQKQEA
jgi:hypothetical protein